MKFQYDGKILLCDFFFSINFVEGMFFIYEDKNSPETANN